MAVNRCTYGSEVDEGDGAEYCHCHAYAQGAADCLLRCFHPVKKKPENITKN
jgi:hypothetical protein